MSLFQYKIEYFSFANLGFITPEPDDDDVSAHFNTNYSHVHMLKGVA